MRVVAIETRLGRIVATFGGNVAEPLDRLRAAVACRCSARAELSVSPRKAAPVPIPTTRRMVADRRFGPHRRIDQEAPPP